MVRRNEPEDFVWGIVKAVITAVVVFFIIRALIQAI